MWFFFRSSGQQRDLLLFVKKQRSAAWSNCIAVASSLELAQPKGLASSSHSSVCLHVCVCHSVIKHCISLRTLSCSARCSNTLVVQKIHLIRTRCTTKSHTSFESGKTAMVAMAGERSKVTHKDFFETNRWRQMMRDIKSLNFAHHKHPLNRSHQETAWRPWQPWTANNQKHVFFINLRRHKMRKEPLRNFVPHSQGRR